MQISRTIIKIFICVPILSLFFLGTTIRWEGMMAEEILRLPEPKLSGGVSFEEALNRRHSVRNFRDASISLREVAQLLWACAGKRIDSVSRASRTFPSAGGVYPLNVYFFVGKVQTLRVGIYKYDPDNHTLELLRPGDYRRKLASAALGQVFIANAPASIVITANYSKTWRVYGDRGSVRYVHMDAGHAAQNVYLQATSLGLGTVAVGAFIDDRVKKILDLQEEEPLYILPVGWPRR